MAIRCTANTGPRSADAGKSIHIASSRIGCYHWASMRINFCRLHRQGKSNRSGGRRPGENALASRPLAQPTAWQGRRLRKFDLDHAVGPTSMRMTTQLGHVYSVSADVN